MTGPTDEPKFYPIHTNYSVTDSSRIPPAKFYEELERYRLSDIESMSIRAEAAWYSCLQPEYKAWPAAVAAMAATSVEIGCEHLRLPFPAFVIRLPEKFVQEEGAPPIETLMVTLMRNHPLMPGSFATTSMRGPSTACGGKVHPSRLRNLGEDVEAILNVKMAYQVAPGIEGSRFSMFSVGLVEGETLESRFSKIHWDDKVPDIQKRWYAPNEKLVRELLALAVGTSFLATSKVRRPKPVVTGDKRPRHERRRFEKENDGEQPTFHVGRDLILPREGGVDPAPQGATGEGQGQQLRWSHFRTGHMRYQPYGKREAPTYELIFVEPTIIRPDLPLKPRLTPGAVREIPPDAFDVSNGPPGSG